MNKILVGIFLSFLVVIIGLIFYFSRINRFRIIYDYGEVQTRQEIFNREFEKISIGVEADVDFELGDQNFVEISAGIQNLNLIEFNQTSRTLEIKKVDGIHPNLGFLKTDNPRTRIRIVFQNLDELETNSNVRFFSSKLNSPNLKVINNGSGSIVIREVEAEEINIINNASGLVQISGTTQVLKLESNSSGKNNLFGLVSQQAFVSSTSTGNSDISVDQVLDVRIESTGNIRYRGDPEVKRRLNGSGSLEQV